MHNQLEINDVLVNVVKGAFIQGVLKTLRHLKNLEFEMSLETLEMGQK